MSTADKTQSGTSTITVTNASATPPTPPVNQSHPIIKKQPSSQIVTKGNTASFSRSSSSSAKVSDTVTINATNSTNIGETANSNAIGETSIINAINTQTTKTVIVNFDTLAETNKNPLISQGILASLKANQDKTLIIKTNNSSIEIKSNSDGQVRFTENGAIISGFTTLGNADYYLDYNGIMQTEWIKTQDGNWYHFNADSGVRDSKWFQDVDGFKYYLDETTAIMKTSWFKDANNTWYYFDRVSGAMKTGWIQDNGKWYYLYSDGKLAVSTTIEGYSVNEKGEWV